MAKSNVVRNPLIKRRMYGGPDAWRCVGGPDGLLRSYRPFDSGSGSMRAEEPVDGVYSGPFGQLPTPFIDQVLNRTWLYMVVSYRTPIAGLDMAGELWLPSVRYSVTTSHHQSLCRTWLYDLNGKFFGWTPEDEA